MKFTVNRLLMYQAVKTVLKVVRPRREIPEIGGLLVEADGSKGILTITGTDVRTHIQRRLRLEHRGKRQYNFAANSCGDALSAGR